jgi:hypothetical protein
MRVENKCLAGLTRQPSWRGNVIAMLSVRQTGNAINHRHFTAIARTAPLGRHG